MDELFEIVSRMAPEDALSEITKVLGRLMRDLDSEERERFLVNLVGQSEDDKVAGMVHF